MTHAPRNPFEPIEKRDFDALVTNLSGSNNRSKVQAVKKALWTCLFLDADEAEWLFNELEARGFKKPE